MIPGTDQFRDCCIQAGITEPVEMELDWTVIDPGLVDGIDKLFSKYELDGLYFDGTTEAFRCQNTLHCCGWRDDRGNLHPTYPLLARRQMMRRIHDVVHQPHWPLPDSGSFRYHLRLNAAAFL